MQSEAGRLRRDQFEHLGLLGREAVAQQPVLGDAARRSACCGAIIGMQIAAHRAWACEARSSPNRLAPVAGPTITGWPVRITVWNIDIGRSSAPGASCANCTDAGGRGLGARLDDRRLALEADQQPALRGARTRA